MNSTLIGHIALNIATAIYLIWLVPQLIHTFKCRQTATISLSMHSLLVLGYLSDMVYVIGQHFPVQCAWVAISGVCSMFIFHCQLGFYHQWKRASKIIYSCLSLFFACLLIGAITVLTVVKLSSTFYNALGLFSCFCWLAYLWPQLMKNHRAQTTRGLSQRTLYLSLLSGLADMIAAFALNFAWPSRVGTLLGLLPKSLMLMQFYYYKLRRQEAFAYAS